MKNKSYLINEHQHFELNDIVYEINFKAFICIIPIEYGQSYMLIRIFEIYDKNNSYYAANILNGKMIEIFKMIRNI